MFRLIPVVIVAVTTVVSARIAIAEEPWRFRFTPYAWLPSLQLDANEGGTPSVTSETDVLDVLDFAFLAAGEARKGKWGLLFEFNYLALSDEASFLGGQANIDTELKGVMGGAAVAYRLAENEQTRLDVFGGVRVWSLETNLEFRRLPTVSRDTTLLDPIVGLRVEHDIKREWFVSGLAEVGGFGVGSELQWEVIGRVGYRITERTAIALGYRHLELDFDRDRIDVEATMTGPFLALDLNW
jgi:hypothetical protein